MRITNNRGISSRTSILYNVGTSHSWTLRFQSINILIVHCIMLVCLCCIAKIFTRGISIIVAYIDLEGETNPFYHILVVAVLHDAHKRKDNQCSIIIPVMARNIIDNRGELR